MSIKCVKRENPGGSEHDHVSIAVLAITPADASHNIAIGFSGTVQAADATSVPFSVGDDVFGIIASVDTPCVGDVISIHFERMARMPSNLDRDTAAHLAKLSVAAWLVLFEHLDIGSVSSGDCVFVCGDAPQLMSFIAQFAQLMTDVDVIVGLPAGVKEHSMQLREGRDLVVTDLDGLVQAIKSDRRRSLRFVVLVGDCDAGGFSLAGLTAALKAERGHGNFRVLDFAWSNDLGWDAIANSKHMVSDILSEVRTMTDRGLLASSVALARTIPSRHREPYPSRTEDQASEQAQAFVE
jgi:hypothetical protein